MSKNTNYLALVKEISQKIYDSIFQGNKKITQSEIKEFYVSNGQDLKDFDTYLKDVNETLAEMTPE